MKTRRLPAIALGTLVSLSSLPTPTTLAATTSVNSVIVQHLINQDQSFVIPLSVHQANQAVMTILKKQEYLYRLLSDASYYGDSSRTTVYLHWRQTKKQSQQVDARIRQILKQIIKPGMSDYDKEKVIHDYVVLHTAYDNSLTRYSPYNALFQGSAVCEGYATLTYRMLTLAGLSAHLVEGTADGQSHLWDEVRVGGKWYFLDPTWDDPVPNVPGRVEYTYYNLSASQLANDHAWNPSGLPPANTDFEKTIEDLLPKTKDSGIAQIAKSIGLYQDVNSQVVTSDSMAQVVQQDILQKKTKIILKYEGTMDDASSAVNDLLAQSLTGFINLRTNITPDRDTLYCIITIRVTY